MTKAFLANKVCSNNPAENYFAVFEETAEKHTPLLAVRIEAAKPLTDMLGTIAKVLKDNPDVHPQVMISCLECRRGKILLLQKDSFTQGAFDQYEKTNKSPGDEFTNYHMFSQTIEIFFFG